MAHKNVKLSRAGQLVKFSKITSAQLWIHPHASCPPDWAISFIVQDESAYARRYLRLRSLIKKKKWRGVTAEGSRVLCVTEELATKVYNHYLEKNGE